MRWTLTEVAGALRVAPPSGLDPLARVAGVSIDSRSVRTGELFFAIHGPRHDGHTFVDSALACGALAAVVARDRLDGFAPATRGKLFGVADTTAALGELARAVRRRWGRRVAGGTRPGGQDQTKKKVAAVAGAAVPVVQTEGQPEQQHRPHPVT